MLKQIHVYAAAALIAALSTPASATTAVRLSNDAMAAAADIIAVGTAIDVQAAWEGRTLVTVVTLKVNESLKGNAGATLSVALPGGVDANRRVPVAMTYAGAPSIAIGEEVFVFLSRDEDVQSGLTVVGFSQGKFSIVTDPAGNRFVSRDLTTLMLDGGAGITSGTRSLMSLDEFRAEIAAYVR
jgi:hypothetical protein